MRRYANLGRALTSATLAMIALSGACSQSGAGGADGGVVIMPGGTKDVAFVRESRGGFGSTEPAGLRNLEVLLGTTRTALTKATTLPASICQQRCLLTPDKRRLVYQRLRSGIQEVVSVPVDAMLVPSLGTESVLNTKPLLSAAMYLIPGTDRVLFVQVESNGGTSPDGGMEPPTFSVVSVPWGGGSMLTYRTATFLPSSPIGVAPDGKRILFAETLGASNVLNLFSLDAATPPSTPRPIFNYEVAGSAEFGGELLTTSFNGDDVYVATQVDGDRLILKLAGNGTTTAPPPSRRLGPTECQAAADNEVCLIQSELYVSRDGSKLFFLGGRQVGVEILSQLYSLNTDLQSPPKALTNFTTEVLSLSMNRDRTRVLWATQAEQFRRNNAVFIADFDGTQLKNTTRYVDDPMMGLSNNYQEAYFLE